MRRLFIDTSVPVYAAGGEHRLRAPCRALVADAASGAVQLHASVELVQEFLHHRLRRGSRDAAVEQARELSRVLVLHPFDAETLRAAVDLVDESQMGGRDAVHAATALLAGFEQIVSSDRDFDAVTGLHRVEPDAAR